MFINFNLFFGRLLMNNKEFSFAIRFYINLLFFDLLFLNLLFFDFLFFDFLFFDFLFFDFLLILINHFFLKRK